MKWHYVSMNVSGNLHDAVHAANTLGKGEWDIVAMESSGYNSIIVYRVPCADICVFAVKEDKPCNS